MSISNVSTGSIPLLTNFAAGHTSALTPEALLLYCSSRLEALDKNIKQYFDEQNRRNKAATDAGKAMSIISAWDHVLGSDAIKGNAGHVQNHTHKANELLALYRSTNDPAVKRLCAHAFKQVSGLDITPYATDPNNRQVAIHEVQAAANAGHIKEVAAPAWQSLIEDIKTEQASMSKSAEMNMIQLQSLVSQRQLAVQLTTQLMQTGSDTLKQCVANFK
jgi:hypothetical protein